MRICLQRREFIAALGGAAAAWPLAAGAQQGERVRRIGVLTGGDENDPVWKARISAFTQALAGLNWTDGRNVRMDLRSGGGEINRIRASAQELVGLQPIILAASTPATVALQWVPPSGSATRLCSIISAFPLSCFSAETAFPKRLRNALTNEK